MKPLNTQKVFPLIVLTLLAALTFWLDYVTRTDVQNLDGRNRHDPDFIAENFTIRRFDATGKLQHTFTAQKMTHFPDDDSTAVNTPRINFPGKQSNSFIQSKEALVSKDAKQILFSIDVHAEQEASLTSPAISLDTDHLTVFPDDEFMKTADPVTIKQSTSKLHGIGMEANNIFGTMRLLSHVTGTIEVKRSSSIPQ